MTKSNSIFKFKQFDIVNKESAMKVNTDGVLLGAWAPIEEYYTQVWDVGSGTGLIALMLAQRSNANISAIEIEKNAYEESILNFNKSKWAERIEGYHADICEICDILPKPNLIVSNPPFFDYKSNGLMSPNLGRAMARHESTLTLSALMRIASRCLDDNGKLSLIAPYERKEELEFEASICKMYPHHITNVRTVTGKQFKRVLMSFVKKPEYCYIDDLTIRYDAFNYNNKFKQLVKEFYLNVND